MNVRIKTTVGALCARVCSGGTPKSSNPEFYATAGIPWLNTKEIDFNRIRSTEKYITEKGLNASAAKWVDVNSVIVAMYGATAGKCCINKIPLTTNQACCNLTADPEICDYRFLYFYLCDKYRELALLANGGAQQNLNAQIIKNFEIDLPPLETQRKIAAILSALDDKIELNRRINANLEEQAFAVFADLLENARSGECRLVEIVEFGPKYALRKNEVARCVEMKQLSTVGSFPLGWETAPYRGGTRFANGDTLLARITPCLENGKAAYVNFLNEGETAFGSTEYIVMRSRGVYPAEFFYCLARNPAFVDYAIKNLNGTSGRQRVSSETLGEFALPRLTEEEIAIFRNAVAPSFEKIRNNGLENNALAAVRDALLPRLISGEIDVANVSL